LTINLEDAHLSVTNGVEVNNLYCHSSVYMRDGGKSKSRVIKTDLWEHKLLLGPVRCMYFLVVRSTSLHRMVLPT